MPYRKNILCLPLVSTHVFHTRSFSKIKSVCASEKMHRRLELLALDDRLFKALEVVGGEAELHSCAAL